MADVLRAGTDVDCTSFVPTHAQSALNKKVIEEVDIDTVLLRLFRVRIRLGHFDTTPLDSIGPETICSDYAKELGRDGVRQGTVLLKNNHQALPLGTVKSVAVIGPNANLSQAIALYYGGTPCDGKYFNLVDAVQQYVPNTVVEPGLPSVTSTDTSGFAAAVQAAKQAEVVILGMR